MITCNCFQGRNGAAEVEGSSWSAGNWRPPCYCPHFRGNVIFKISKLFQRSKLKLGVIFFLQLGNKKNVNYQRTYRKYRYMFIIITFKKTFISWHNTFKTFMPWYRTLATGSFRIDCAARLNCIFGFPCTVHMRFTCVGNPSFKRLRTCRVTKHLNIGRQCLSGVPICQNEENDSTCWIHHL